MIKHSKYLQYYDTEFVNLTPRAHYHFKGTCSGWAVVPIRDYIDYDSYHTFLMPVLYFHNVSIDNPKSKDNVIHYPRVCFKYKKWLTGMKLQRGDILSMNIKLSKYIHGGLYGGDLLTSPSNIINLTSKTKSNVSEQMNRDGLLSHLILNDPRMLYQYSLISSVDTGNTIDALICKIIKPTRNKYISKEVNIIQKLLVNFPENFLMYDNKFTHNTQLFFNEYLDATNKNIIKELKELNAKGHLITPSKMKKLVHVTKYTDAFYILIDSLKRTKYFISKAK